MKILGFALMAILISGTGHARSERKKEHGEYLKKELNLTDEQYAKVKKLREADRAELESARSNFKGLKRKFDEAMKKTSSTNEELKKSFDEFQKARDQYQRARFNKMLNMRSVLTPEQLEKFSQTKDKYHGKKGGKRERRK